MADLSLFLAEIAAMPPRFDVMKCCGINAGECVRQRLLRNSRIVGYIHRSGSTMNGIQHGNDQ